MVAIIPQLFFSNDFQTEFQKAIKIGKRRHHNSIYEECGGAPKNVFSDIGKVRADLDLSALPDAGEFVVYRIVIIECFSLHENPPLRHRIPSESDESIIFEG